MYSVAPLLGLAAALGSFYRDEVAKPHVLLCTQVLQFVAAQFTIARSVADSSEYFVQPSLFFRAQARDVQLKVMAQKLQQRKVEPRLIIQHGHLHARQHAAPLQLHRQQD